MSRQPITMNSQVSSRAGAASRTSVRMLHPAERIYTFWDYFRNSIARDSGLRNDHSPVTPRSRSPATAGVEREVCGREKNSDHGPRWVEVREQVIMWLDLGRRRAGR
jgi:exonuclease III